MTFGVLAPDEIATLVGLWESCGLIRPWNDPRADVELALSGGQSTVLVARRDGELAGSVMVGFDGHRGWVYYLAVSPVHQRQGIGRKLMERAEEWLRSRNAPKIQFMVRNDNQPAIGFYAALGMEVQPVVTIGKRLDGKQGRSAMPIIMYGIRNCDTIKKARNWLEAQGVDYAFHDYKSAGIDAATLKGWADELGWEVLLNKAGTTFKKLPEADRQDIDAAKAITLMVANPSMIKRPVLDLGDRRLVGFKPAFYEEAFAA